MLNQPISEDIIINQAIKKGACSKGIDAARKCTCETLPSEYQLWSALHLDLPDEVAEYLYKRVGCRSYWKCGLRHREDGPAFIDRRIREEWWLNGLRHHENGPAVMFIDGYRKWWLNGYYNERDYSVALGALQASHGQFAANPVDIDPSWENL